MNSQTQAALRGISNVLLVSNLNEEVIIIVLQYPDLCSYSMTFLLCVGMMISNNQFNYDNLETTELFAETNSFFLHN